jgi:predicted TIM-barrel fold metal-dependent hydrolase
MSVPLDSTRKRERGAPRDLGFDLPALNVAWATFGAEWLMFGSNWPVSDHFGSYETVVALSREFVKGKGMRLSRGCSAGTR